MNEYWMAFLTHSVYFDSQTLKLMLRHHHAVTGCSAVIRCCLSVRLSVRPSVCHTPVGYWLISLILAFHIVIVYFPVKFGNTIGQEISEIHMNQGFIQPPRRGGELPLKQSYSPPGEGLSTSPVRKVSVLTTSWHVHCMLTCYNTKQGAFILLKN